MIVHNWYKQGTNERLTKLEAGQAQLNKRMDNFETELKEIKKTVALILEKLSSKN